MKRARLKKPERRAYNAREQRRNGRSWGVLCLALLMLTTLTFVAVRYGPPLYQKLWAYADHLCVIKELTIKGTVKTKPKAVLQATGLYKGLPLRLVNVQAVQQRLTQLPWIAQASVKRTWPWQVTVQVRERTPAALWQHQNQRYLLDTRGKIIDVPVRPQSGLVLLVGQNAPRQGPAFLKALKAHCPSLMTHLDMAHLMPSGRWDLYLKNDDAAKSALRLQLPRDNFAHALRRFVVLKAQQTNAKHPFKNVDLRLPHRILVTHHTPTAARR